MTGEIGDNATVPRENLTRFAWLSIAAACATIALKAGAWWLTGSVGLLSDAAESVVNLVAAVVALIALRMAASPVSKEFQFGRTKAEYFSAAIEGIMIFVAAAAIVIFAIQRFIELRPLAEVGLGLGISVVASVINGVVGLVLIRAGKKHNSITLRADGKHLMTDVYTSAGVLLGISLVWFTGWLWLDPLVALLVGMNIAWTGARLLSESARGLLDEAMNVEDNARIREILAQWSSPSWQKPKIRFHAVRTRISGSRSFLEFHMLVPGDWTVQRGHDAMEDLIDVLVEEFPELQVLGHLEPIEDPRSYEDQELGASRSRSTRITADGPVDWAE